MTDTASVERQLTLVEKSLLERGIDISKLPRGPNGELLRGPTGGIALVKNPKAPTHGDIDRFNKNRKLRERLTEIDREIQNYQGKQLSLEDGHRLNVLLTEQLEIKRSLGFPIHTQGGNPDVVLELQRFKFELMSKSPDGYPVSAAPKLADFYRKLQQPERADAYERAAKQAIENGKEIFTLIPSDN